MVYLVAWQIQQRFADCLRQGSGYIQPEASNRGSSMWLSRHVDSGGVLPDRFCVSRVSSTIELFPALVICLLSAASFTVVCCVCRHARGPPIDAAVSTHRFDLLRSRPRPPSFIVFRQFRLKFSAGPSEVAGVCWRRRPGRNTVVP